MADYENKEHEIQVADWIETTIGESLFDKADLWASLKNGVVLCKLVNKIKPGTIPSFNTTRLLPLLEMDNIQIYLKALWQLGVSSQDLFVTPDLYKNKGMPSVLQSIHALSTLAPSLGYKGPLIGENALKTTTTQKVRLWGAVEMPVIMSEVGGSDSVIHSLRITITELNEELTALKELVQTTKVPNVNVEQAEELARVKQQLLDEQRERDLLEHELILFRKRTEVSNATKSSAELAELHELQKRYDLLSAENMKLSEQVNELISSLMMKEGNIQQLRADLAVAEQKAAVKRKPPPPSGPPPSTTVDQAAAKPSPPPPSTPTSTAPATTTTTAPEGEEMPLRILGDTNSEQLKVNLLVSEQNLFLMRTKLKETKEELANVQMKLVMLVAERETQAKELEDCLQQISKADLDHKEAQRLLQIEAAKQLEIERKEKEALNEEKAQFKAQLNVLETDMQVAKVEYARVRKAILEREEALVECDATIKTLQQKAVFCHEGQDGDSNEEQKSLASLDPKVEQAQSKLKALLNAGASTNMENSDIAILNAFVTNEAGRRAFTRTMQTHVGDILLTRPNFQLMLNLIVNMLGEMLVSKSLDFHTMSVVMMTCERVFYQEEVTAVGVTAQNSEKKTSSRFGGGGQNQAKATITKKTFLQSAPEIKTYFGQLSSSFWEEFFWHKLTLSYKKGDREMEGEHQHEEKKGDAWTIGLLLEFSWEMSHWGVQMDKVRDLTNEVGYFGLGLDNAALIELMGSIESYVKNRNKGLLPDKLSNNNSDQEEAKVLRKGSVLEASVHVMESGKKKDKRFFILTPSALVSFKNEKTFVPLSYLTLHAEVIMSSQIGVNTEEWLVSLQDPEIEDSQITLVFVSLDQKNEWMNCISRVLTGAEVVLHTSNIEGEKQAPKRLVTASSTAVVLSGGVLALRDIVNVSSRMRALANGPNYNQPVEHLVVNSCSLGRYTSPFFDELIRRCPSLVSLSLSNCGLGDRGVILLSRLLESNSVAVCLPSLAKLDVERNGITKVGAARLATAVAFHSSLTDITLSLNFIQDVGAKLWADCLQTNTVLKVARFLVCGFTDKGAKAFLRVLDPNFQDLEPGFCSVLSCASAVEPIIEKGGKTRKSAYCLKHRPQAMPGMEPTVTVLINHTVQNVDLSGNNVMSAGALKQLVDRLAVRNGQVKKTAARTCEITSSSTVDEVVAWSKRVAKISPAATQILIDSKLDGAAVLEMANSEQTHVEEQLQELGFTRGAAVMLAKSIVTAFGPA